MRKASRDAWFYLSAPSRAPTLSPATSMFYEEPYPQDLEPVEPFARYSTVSFETYPSLQDAQETAI